MNLRDFLTLLLPPNGVIYTATRTTKGWRNTAHSTIESAVAHVNTLTFEHQPAYFAVATYDKARYWDGVEQRWRSRTQANARFLKSFFLDLDVEPGNPLKFESKTQALVELKAFVQQLGLPRPLLVDSGGGIHAYWPLTEAVTVDAWRPVADLFKQLCLAVGFKADRSLTADQARVLRALGGYNTRRNAPVRLLGTAAPLSLLDFSTRLGTYAAQVPAATPRGAVLPGLSGVPNNVWDGQDNLGASSEPVNFDRVLFHCAQLQQQVVVRGAGISEPLWRAALAVAKFSATPELAARLLSDGHAEFSEASMRAKLANWHAGPPTCEHFHGLNPTVCEGCPHWGNLTSPVQLGRVVTAAPAPTVTLTIGDAPPVVVTLPQPPAGYTRRVDGAIVIETEDGDGRPHHTVVCPYDLYPLAIRSQSGETIIDEHSLWRAHLPLAKGGGLAARDFDVPLGVLGDSKALTKLLYSKGVILQAEQAKMTQHYMSAYLQKLARESGRVELYERLGWHDDHQVFVMADRVFHLDGRVVPHVPSGAITVATKGLLHAGGTLAGWQAAMQFYNRPGYEAHRFFVYLAGGTILQHMHETGTKGVIVAATGASGRGKTTCLRVCSSVWGHQDSLMLNGNREGSTVNAMYATIGTNHSLPICIDDTTERDIEEFRRLLLNFSQGEGKRRLQADGSAAARLDTWWTTALISTNADSINALMATGGDVSAHLMRLLAVEFELPDTGAEAKILADHFIRAIGQHYGHAGPLLLQQVTQHYAAIKQGYLANIEMVDRRLGSRDAAAERFWSGTLGTAYSAGQLLSKAGILDFPYQADLEWMLAMVQQQRTTISESSDTPLEWLVGFLNAYLRHTLIISAKGSSNLDNVAQRPSDTLLVRHEIDRGLVYIDRAALRDYCDSARTNFRALEWQLRQDGVLLDHTAQKVLGADTIFSAGQSRCWKVDDRKLGGGLLLVPNAAPVTPLAATGKKP